MGADHTSTHTEKDGHQTGNYIPVVYTDPNKIDVARFKSDLKKGDKEAAGRQIAEQLDAQTPGL